MSELIEQLLAALDIVSLVGFDGQGSNPIHGSSTGVNLHVDSDKNTWYCHSAGCKVGGGPLQWIASQLQGTCTNDIRDWQKVLKEACRITGIEYTSNLSKELTSIQDVFNHATAYFQQQLEQRPELYEYIHKKWGFTREQVRTIRIGYAPEYYNFYEYSKDTTLLLKTGLFYENMKPHMRNRLVIPYLVDGMPRYFIARSIDMEGFHSTDNFGKYIKLLKYDREKRPYVSKEVVEPLLYSNNIYDTDSIIIVEGIADFYTLSLRNYPVITPVTISFKDTHYYQLQKYIRDKEVYIANDNEVSQAGLQGAIRMMKRINHAKIVDIPRPDTIDKMDVNDYFKQHSKDEFDKLLRIAKPGYHYLSLQHLAQIPLDEITKEEIRELAIAYCVVKLDNDNPMYILKAMKSDKEDQLLYYNNGIYEPDTNNQWLRGEITSYLNTNNLNRIDVTTSVKTEVVKQVKDTINTTKEHIHFDRMNRFNYEDNDKILINCLNGIVQIDKKNKYTIELLPHSPEYMFRSKLQVNYIHDFEESQAGLYIDTVRDIVTLDSDEAREPEFDIEEYKLWMMEMAYLLIPGSFLQHMPHIVGIGNTGKSTIIVPVERMFHYDHVADTSLGLLVDNDYGSGNLYDIDLLSINEIDKDPTKGLEILKKLGTMETITINPKYVQMIKNYQIKNKTVMRSNHYLKLQDSSEKRRLFLFRAKQKFDRSKVDPDREKRLIAIKDEIFNLLLGYIPDVYTYRLELKSVTVDRYDRHYKLYGNPIRIYMRDHMYSTDSDDDFYTVQQIMEYFNRWASDIGFDTIDSDYKFGGRLRKLAEDGIAPLFDVSQKRRKTVDGKKVTVWCRIQYTSSFSVKYIQYYDDIKQRKEDEPNFESPSKKNLNDFL